MDSIYVKDLVKKFGGFTAVDSVSFSVHEGEIFGLLGPNGAGKTTIINILTTILKPTSGFVKVAGIDIKNRPEVRRNIGIVFQDPALDNKLTGRENLDFHARMYGLDKKSRSSRIKEVLELVELTEKADVVVEKYSGGMKRRLEIARGLLQKPKVLFLDEPTLGLDVQTRRKIWHYIEDLRKEENITILLTTHYIEEADYLCDRVAIINEGKIIAVEKPSKIREMVGGEIISVKIDGKAKPFKDELIKNGLAKEINERNGLLDITVEKGETKLPLIIKKADKLGLNIDYVSFRKPSLEDAFLKLTGRKISDEFNNIGKKGS
ncbi:MAG: ATP-binding cassette domain-containing protein [Candidatus Diapherotrites archaeon]|nr:ATP-binding cassette domain-containing protein [Candidatus Diapherotrites archaeon]